MNQDWLKNLAANLGDRLTEARLTLSTAESCTGGGIGYSLTAVPGSSRWYLGGVVAYANQVKTEKLGVPQDLLDCYGAVSQEVAESMAFGVSKFCSSNVAMSTTGVAGPDGGSPEKPVGMVCFGWMISDTRWSETMYFDGDRESVRQQSIEYGLKTLLKRL